MEVSKTCSNCNLEFSFPLKRGRQPSECPACKEAKPQDKEVTIECVGCQTEFSYERKRGRPPTVCPTCKEKRTSEVRVVREYKVKATLSSVEKVDRLERDLKASGRHISQHRDKW